MVLGTFMKRGEINSSTSTSDNSTLKEMIYSSDEYIINQSSSLSSNLITEGNEEKIEVENLKTYINISDDDNSSFVLSLNHNEILSNEKHSTLSNHDDIEMHNDIEILKNKLLRVLKRREQYKRRVKSLTNGIIALRGTKLKLERKINGVKLLWSIKHNKEINM